MYIMKQLLILFVACAATLVCHAKTVLRTSIVSTVGMCHYPVVIPIKAYGKFLSGKVLVNGKEVPSQVDDFDNDGIGDEICFMMDLQREKTENVTITLNDDESKPYPAKTYAEMVLRNPKVKEKNKQDIYISAITIDKATANPYNVLHHHGVAFENELIAMRIYMDKRQTIDLYGKYHKGLELHDTQFYTSKEQKAKGYGDDILWVGNSFGLGALRGWNGTEPSYIEPVEHRTQRIVAQGPVRTIVEMEDNGWAVDSCQKPIDMKIRYTLYAGRRDFDVQATFRKTPYYNMFSTGLVNVKGSSEFSDHKGLRGCWGTAWPANDTVNWKKETVGLGIYIPKRYIVKELDATADNYGYVIKTIDKEINYKLTYSSANEDFGFHDKVDWFDYLKKWKRSNEATVKVTVHKLEQTQN